MRSVAWILAGTLWLGMVGRAAESDRDTVFQVSTLAALLDGHYEGETTLGALRRHGDFGIGTFEGLDGELILLDGVFHQARADGQVLKPADEVRTPFACVTRFEADQRIVLAEGLDFDGLRQLLDERCATAGMPYAIRVSGTFRKIKVRSVPAQTQPYPPLSEVVKRQPVFDYEDVEGTLVGFSLPPSLEGVNVPGYHLHLVSRDGTKGGHLLAFTLAAGVAEVDDSPEVRLVFSAAAARAGMGTRKASREEIERVEKERK